MNKRLLIFAVSLIAILATSCKKEEEENDGLNGNPISGFEDPAHVVVENRYGIVAVCDTGAWHNEYSDTASIPSAYQRYGHSRVTLYFAKDAVKNPFDTTMVSYVSYVMLNRFFYEPTDEADALKYLKDYHYDAYAIFNGSGANYDQVTDLEEVVINGFSGYHFSANLVNYNPGHIDVYMFYFEGRLYFVQTSSMDEYSSEEAKKKCAEVVNTIRLGSKASSKK